MSGIANPCKKNTAHCVLKMSKEGRIMAIKILGTGAYVPPLVVTNDDLSKMVETSDEWITQRVGVSERRISTDETTADMAIKAAKSALESASVTPGDIDLIVAASVSNELLCPTVAGSVQRAIGASCPAFDINSACSGFLFALETAKNYILGGNYKNALVIGAERMSNIIDWTDRSTCVIFGDGAGAMVITKGENYLASRLYTSGGNEVIEIPGFQGDSPFYKKEKKKSYVFMDGQETFKFAVSKMVEDVKYVADKAGVSLEDIDYIVPHQANTRIIEFAAKRLKIAKEKFIVNIQKLGNTSAASVAIAFDELYKSGKLKKGDKIAICAFGGGLSSAACLIEY